MAVFKNDEKGFETIIGPSMKVDGKFRGQGNVIVEGAVNGTLRTDQHLTVAKDAKISANVFADNAQIAGEVKGSIKVKGLLELLETAKIYGDVEAKSISVSVGAIIHGKCCMDSGVPIPEDNSKVKKKKKTGVKKKVGENK